MADFPYLDSSQMPALIPPSVARQTAMAPLSLPPIGGMASPMPSLPMPTMPSVVSAPTQTQTDQNELARLNATGSGISQIQNPLGHAAAAIGGGLLHTLLPGLARQIGGTQDHHDLLVRQMDQRVADDYGHTQAAANLSATLANTAHAQAATNVLENPTDKFSALPTDSGYAAFDPTTGTAKPITAADGSQLATPDKAPPAPHYVTTSDGNVVAIMTGKDGTPSASTVYEGKPKQNTEITKLEVGGKPHTVIVDKDTGATVKDLGETGEKPPSVSVSSGGTFQMAQVPDGQGGMKTVLFNNKSGQVSDAPTGLAKGSAPTSTGTVADKNRSSLAHIAMNNLDQMQSTIQRRPDMLGAGAGRITSVEQMLGSNDPDIVALGSQMHNFAMANAGIHGSRSAENVKAQEDEMLNHFHNGPQGLLGGINANRQNLNSVIAVTEGGKQAGGQSVAPTGLSVSLAAARNLPQNSGKSDAAITADIQSHGHTVRP